jgi:hypothetical protein
MTVFGEQHGRAILRSDEVSEIREMLRRGSWSLRGLARCTAWPSQQYPTSNTAVRGTASVGMTPPKQTQSRPRQPQLWRTEMAKNQGIRSKNVVRKPVRTGAARQGPHVAGVAQIGQRVGDHSTEKRSSSGYRGEDLIGPKRPISVKLGNEVAATTTCGVGGSRTIYKSGGQHGLTDRPMPEGREIFPGFSGKGKG